MRENLRGPKKQPPPCSKVGLMGKKPGFRTLSTNLDIKLAQFQCPGSPSAPVSLLHTEPVPATRIQIQRGWGAGHQPRTILGFSTAGKHVSNTISPVPHRRCLDFFCNPNLGEILKAWKGQDSRGTVEQNRCVSMG